ncbi:MAG: GNAT family N-acetyltransferase [Elainellaceae cyanobacterium]
MISPNAVVTLREITRENLADVLRLKVAEAQGNFVASNAVSIAQAHFYPEVAWFRAIYAGETPIGFVMVEDDSAKQSYSLWRFMLDARFQKLGFGRQALALAVEYVKTRPGAKALFTSHVPGEGNAGPFYEKQGFAYTGEQDEDGELIMRLDL